MTDTMNDDTRKKGLIFGVGALVLIALGVGYLFWASGRVDQDLAARQERAQEAIDEFEASADAVAPAATPTAEPEVSNGPVPQSGEVVVVNRVPGDDYGRLAIRHDDGTRTLLDRRCLRVHVSAGKGVCLAEEDGVVVTYSTTFFDADDPAQPQTKSYASPLPSRVRVSPNGSFMSSTGFLSGTSYEDIGGETTTIVIFDAVEGKSVVGLEQFTINGDADRYSPGLGKFWGVSFVDDDNFYVTGHFGEVPEILEGRRSSRTLQPTNIIGSCPSVSPDGRNMVYKQMRDGGGFDLVVRDLETDETRMLDETRSVDDQVEWLDNDTILYALHPDEGDVEPLQPNFDIWSLDITPGAEPQLFLPAADSPAVIR